MMKMMIKIKMGITQPIFKLGPPDFAQQQIFVIPTNDDNDDDYNDYDDSNDDNDDDGNDNEKPKWPPKKTYSLKVKIRNQRHNKRSTWTRRGGQK